MLLKINILRFLTVITKCTCICVQDKRICIATHVYLQFRYINIIIDPLDINQIIQTTKHNEGNKLKVRFLASE